MICSKTVRPSGQGVRPPSLQKDLASVEGELVIVSEVLSAFYIPSCSMWSRRMRLSLLGRHVTAGSLIAGCLSAGTTKPLGIFVGCIKFILRVAVSALDCGLKPLSPVAQSRSPLFRKEG